MENMVEEIIKGRKTFFIAPDKSLLPESYLEEYLTKDYECYFIDNDRLTSLQVKVESILSVFKDALIFFNIDTPVHNLKWDHFIKDLMNKHKEAKFGVIYTKRQSLVEKQAIEWLYLYNMGLQCGCIQLEYQKRNNFGIIEKTLYANQAMGRRKNVRAVCPTGCGFDMTTDSNTRLTGRINDISVSHFSCICDNDVQLKDYEKFSDISLKIKGLQIRSDAVLYMHRETPDGTLYVFAFTNKDGQSGLDSFNKQLLVPKMYEIMNENCSNLIKKLAIEQQNQSTPDSIAHRKLDSELEKLINNAN